MSTIQDANPPDDPLDRITAYEYVLIGPIPRPLTNFRTPNDRALSHLQVRLVQTKRGNHTKRAHERELRAEIRAGSYIPPTTRQRTIYFLNDRASVLVIINSAMEQVRRYNVERSCLRCHERKVRCDKAVPCNKCVRLNVPCQYPGPRRAKRRSPKTMVTDVAARLEQLERSITALAGDKMAGVSAQVNQMLAGLGSNAQSSPVSLAIEPVPGQSTRSAGDEESPRGFLSRDGNYVDDPVLSQVLEKEKDLRNAMGSPNTENPSSRKPPPLKVDGIIVNPLLLQTDFKSLFPTRWEATLLWQTFLSRVDPVLKVIHVPTTTPRIFMAISRPDAVSPDVHCLLFAIFFAATTALVSDDPLNEKTRENLRQYQKGMEIAMHNSSFLDSPTVTSLQAMAIYLVRTITSLSTTTGFSY